MCDYLFHAHCRLPQPIGCVAGSPALATLASRFIVELTSSGQTLCIDFTLPSYCGPLDPDGRVIDLWPEPSVDEAFILSVAADEDNVMQEIQETYEDAG
jgi:hypothetical protein